MQERVKSQLITFNPSRCRQYPPKGWSEMCGTAEKWQAGKSNSLNVLISSSNLLQKLHEALSLMFLFIILESCKKSRSEYFTIFEDFVLIFDNKIKITNKYKIYLNDFS